MDPVTVAVASLFFNNCYIFLTLLSVPTYDFCFGEEIGLMWESLATFVHAFLSSGIFALPAPRHRLQYLLFPSFQGNNRMPPRDVSTELALDPQRFFRMTGETPESFLRICHDLHPFLTNQRAGQRHLHDTNNIILMALIWLWQYSTYDVLSTMFNMNPGAVSTYIHAILPLLWMYFKSQIYWPTQEEWLQRRGGWEMFPNAVGAVGGTLHEIQRPSQVQYF